MSCVLITGGTKGIGRAIALQLSIEHGLHVLLNYSSDANAAEEALNDLITKGGSAELLQFQVQDKTAVDKALSNWQNKNPEKTISVLVNNAGITKDSLLMWMKEDDWDAVVDVSLKGMFNVTRFVIPYMLKNRFGRIINISSLSGLKGLPGQMNYSAAKAGLIGATKSLAQEVAKRNVTVNAVAPGFIQTTMTKELDERHLQLIPMKRMGSPEEVAHLVSFLASEKASYITGEVININGGLYS